MLIGFRRGATGIVLRVKILNSSVATGAGLTGLTSASSGLRIGTIADNEATSTAYTVAGSTIETVTTLGTYATPTATKCRFREVDATSHKGVYELQIADARFAVSSAKFLLVSLSGATNAAETDVVIPLRDLDPYDAVRAGLTALPNAAAGASTGLPVVGTQVPNATAGASGGLFIAGTNAATTVTTALTTTFTGNLTGSVGSVTGAVGSVTGLTASDVGAIKTKTDFLPSATAGAAGGVFIAGTNAATTVTTAFTTTFTGNLTGSVGSVTGAVGSVTGNVGGNVTGSVGSISGVTFPTNFGVLAIAATTGQVGIDWANIKSPTTTVALTGTTVATVTNQLAATAIADAVLSRNVSNVEGTMPEHCIGSIVLAVLEYSTSGTTWTIKRTDGVSTHLTKTLTTASGADSITSVG